MNNRTEAGYQDDFTDREIDEMYQILSHVTDEKVLMLPAQSLLEHAQQGVKAASPLLDADQLENLLDPLLPHSWHKRALACWLLGRGYLPPETRSRFVGPLCALLKNEQQTSVLSGAIQRSVQWALRGTAISAIPYAIGCFFMLLQNEMVSDSIHEEAAKAAPWLQSSWLAALFAHPPANQGNVILRTNYFLDFPQALMDALQLLILLMGVTLPLLAILRSIKTRHTIITSTVRKWAAFALGRMGFRESIPLLRSVALYEMADISMTAAQALVHLSPELDITSGGTGDPALSARLCDLLKGGFPPYSLPILRMLERIGDGKAAAAVERLIQSHDTIEVRETAARILPILQERKRQEENRHILVRPSSAADMPTEDLLRPAFDTRPVEAEQLLRPRSRE